MRYLYYNKMVERLAFSAFALEHDLPPAIRLTRSGDGPAMTVVRDASPGSIDIAGLTAGLVTVTAWGSAFVAIRGRGRRLLPGALALGRLLVAASSSAPSRSSGAESLPGRRDLVAIAVFGVLWLGVYSVTLNAAEHRVDAGTAAMLINTGPILIAMLAGVFLNEGFPPRLFAGVARRLRRLRADRHRLDRVGRKRRRRRRALPRRGDSPTRSRSSSRSRCSRASRRCR